MRQTGGERAVIGIDFVGGPEALDWITKLDAAMAAMNSGGSGSAAASAPLGGSAAPDPYGFNGGRGTGTGFFGASAPGVGVLSPSPGVYGGSTGTLPAGALAPNPSGTSWNGPASAGGPMQVGNLVIQAGNVTMIGGPGGAGGGGTAGCPPPPGSTFPIVATNYGAGAAASPGAAAPPPPGGTGPGNPGGGGQPGQPSQPGSGGSSSPSSMYSGKFLGVWSPVDLAQEAAGFYRTYNDASYAGEEAYLDGFGRSIAAEEAISVRRNIPIGSSLITLGMAGLGAVVGSVVPGAGTMVGLGVGMAAGSALSAGLSRRNENYALGLDAVDDILQSRAASSFYGGIPGPDAIYDGVQGLDEKELGQQRAFERIIERMNRRVPGSATEDTVASLLGATRSVSLPNGSPQLAGEIGDAQLAMSLRYPELADGSDLGGERNTYRMLEARSGDFDRFIAATQGRNAVGDMDAMMSEFRRFQSLQIDIGRSGSYTSAVRAYAQERTALGASGPELQQAMSWELEAQQAQTALLYEDLEANSHLRGTPTGDKTYAESLVRYRQAKAAEAGLRNQQEMIGFQRSSLNIQASITDAGTSMTRAMYGGGGEAGVLEAFGEQAGAQGRQVEQLRRMAASEFISPEQRRLYGAQADSLQTEIDVMIPRQRGQFVVGLRSSEIGINSASAAFSGTMAGLFGGRGDVLRAAGEQGAVIGQQLDLNQFQIDNARGLGLSQQEENGLKAEQVKLQRELNQVLESAKRGFLDAGVAVARFGQSMTASTTGMRMQFFGVGGGEAAGLQSQNLGASQETLRAAQERLRAVANLPDDNPYKMQARQAVHEAEAGVQGALQSFASLPFSVSLQREAAAGQFAMNALRRSFLPFGDMRGAAVGMMRNVGARGQELNAQQREAMAQLDAMGLPPEEREQRRAVLLRDFEQRRYGLGNEALGYQQQLETGWMDRLISQNVNAPGRSAFVASQFTRREAAPFLQSMTSVFGFSGEGGEEARDQWMFRGPRLANSMIGMIQRPAGFNETAMSGHSMPHTGVLAPGGGGRGISGAVGNLTRALQELERALGSLTGGNQLGAGRSSDVLQNVRAVQNMLSPSHASATAHQ